MYYWRVKVLIINNLKSGYGDGSIYDFVRSFSQEYDEIVIRNVFYETDISKPLKDAEDFDLVVTSGGDDTVAKVSYFLANKGIPILPYPSGTSNLIAQNLDLPIESHALAKLARQCNTQKFDIGEISIGDKKWGFGCNAGVGYSTKISKQAIATRKTFGPFSYIGAALSNFKPLNSQFKIECDEGEIKADGIGILLLNFSKIGLNLSVTHKNLPRDGKLDIVILKGKTALKYIPALTAAALDNAIEFPDRSDAIEVHHSSFAKITAEPQMEIQLDGKTIEMHTPFEAKILKHAANYVIDNSLNN